MEKKKTGERTISLACSHVLHLWHEVDRLHGIGALLMRRGTFLAVREGVQTSSSCPTLPTHKQGYF